MVKRWKVPYKTWGCSICGKQAPVEYHKHNMFKKRMEWIRHHRKVAHGLSPNKGGYHGSK
jgi:hypothetical protein